MGGIQTQLTNRRDELNGLEAYTASLKSAGIVSSSTQIENYNLFAVTSSENTFYDNLNVFGNLTINTGSAVNTYNGLTIGGSDPSLAFKTNSPAGWEWIEFHNNSGTNNFSIGVNQTQPQFVIKAGAGMDSPDVSVNTSGDLTVHNGNLKINTAGKGIDFSATSDGSGTTTSELLDDYEYGTFTPILSDAVTGGNTATGTFYGTYTKIGRQVIIGIGLNDITTSGMTAGNVVYIQGLPFTCGASQVSPGVCNFYNVDIGDNNAIAWLNSAVSSTALRVLKQSPTTNSGLIVSDITSTTAEITLSITYYT